MIYIVFQQIKIIKKLLYYNDLIKKLREMIDNTFLTVMHKKQIDLTLKNSQTQMTIVSFFEMKLYFIFICKEDITMVWKFDTNIMLF